MPTQVQFRRGSTAQNNSFTGAAGELSVNSDINTLRVHDGTTAGGHELAKSNLSNTSGIGILTATKFVGTAFTGSSYTVTGGTSNQFLKADGSLDSNPYILGVGIATAAGLVGVGVTLIDFRGTAVSSVSPVVAGISTVTLLGGGGGGGGTNLVTILSRAGIGITISAPSSALTVYGRSTNTIISI